MIFSLIKECFFYFCKGFSFSFFKSLKHQNLLIDFGVGVVQSQEN